MANINFRKTLLVIEFAIAFWVPVVALAFGLFGTPIALFGFINGNFSGYFVPLLTIGGSLGFWGASQLLAKALDPEIKLASNNRMIIYIACGIASALPLTIMLVPNSVLLAAFSLLPIIVTIQLVVIHRRCFWN